MMDLVTKEKRRPCLRHVCGDHPSPDDGGLCRPLSIQTLFVFFCALAFVPQTALSWCWSWDGERHLFQRFFVRTGPVSQVLRLGLQFFPEVSPYAIFLLAKSSHCLDLVDPLCVPICIICYHWPFLDFQAYRTGIIGSEVAKHQSGHSGLIYSSCDCFWVTSFSLLLMPLRTPHWVLCFWTSFVFAKSSFLLHVGLLHLTDFYGHPSIF